MSFWWVLAAFLLGAILHRLLFSNGHTTKPKKQESVRRKKDYPKIFACGWYPLLNSKDLKVGEVKHCSALSEEFAVFRGTDGKVSALSAFCPHLGANMAVGGTVINNSLRCPFHQWEFDGQGKCTKIPWLDSPPEKISVPTWPILEYYGLILIYYHPNREAPTYIPPLYPEISNGNFTYRGSYVKTIGMHLSEFVENSADIRHFASIHSQMKLPFSRIPIPGVRILHESSWARDEKQSHIAYFFEKAHLSVFGREFRDQATSIITFVGPAGVTIFDFKMQIGRIILFQTHLPLSRFETEVRFNWYAEKSLPGIVVWYVVGNWVSQWKNDIDIWENKTYRSKPFLVKGDGPIMKMRRWYSQFYVDEKDIKNLDW